MDIKVAGGVSNTLADVNSRNQLKVVAETDVATHPETVGGVKLFSENDAGGITGTMYLKSPETSSDYRLRVGRDTLLFEDTFNSLTQNTDMWSYTFATLTAAQPGAGTVNFSVVQGTTNAHGANMRTFRYFPLLNTAPLAIEFLGGIYTAPMVSGEVWLAGLGLPGSAILPPTDGVFFRMTSGGLEGVLKFNNTETSTGILMLQSAITLDEMSKWLIIVGEREVEFWMNDVLLKEVTIPEGNAVPWLGVSAPIFMMKYNTGNVSNTNQIRVAKVGATIMDVDTCKPWAQQMAGMGRRITAGTNGMTMGTLAGNYLGTSAIAATQAGSNTAANASFAGLGGIFQMTAQVGTSGASGDMVAQYHLNPASTINITGRNMVITGVYISTVNFGAAVATTPTTLVWGLAYGGTAITFAQAQSASFATATAHAPKKFPLGIQYAPVAAPIGAKYDGDISVKFDAPVYVRPGEYLETSVRFLVGTATASQTIVYTIMFDGYWE